MQVRNALLALAVLALALLPGAPADAWGGGGVGTQVAGTVYAYTQSLPVAAAPRVGSEEVAATCSYVGHTVPDGRWQFEFVVGATAYSTSSKQPELTTVDCWMETTNGSQVSPHVLIACPGAVCVAGGTAGPWPSQGVEVCVRGRATFGPVSPLEKATDTYCSR